MVSIYHYQFMCFGNIINVLLIVYIGVQYISNVYMGLSIYIPGTLQFIPVVEKPSAVHAMPLYEHQLERSQAL